ncbi:MAG: mechanosensitive ion channel [Lachnospiraceae bacterium]|nr:mechanosensitive ion channel [Lachnospiraceae bacterium]
MKEKRYGVKIIQDLLFIVVGVLILGSVLYLIQNQFAMERQSENSIQKLDIAEQRMESYAVQAAEDMERYDAFGQAKLDVLSFYYTNKEVSDILNMTKQWGLAEMYMLSADGSMEAGTGGENEKFLATEECKKLIESRKPVTVGNIRYYCSTIGDGRCLIGGRDATKEQEAVAEMTAPAYSLHNIKVGSNGYIVAINQESGKIAYHPQEDLIGQDSSAVGMAQNKLVDGYSGWIDRGLESFYCKCRAVNSEYLLISTVPKSEIEQFSTHKITLIMIVFAVILLVVALYINFIYTDRKLHPEDRAQEEYLPIGKHRHLNLTTAKKIKNILLVGVILIFVSSLYIQELNAISAQTIRFDNKLMDIQDIFKENEEKLVKLKDEYSKEYERRAVNIAVLLEKDPTLVNDTKLIYLADEVQVKALYVFDSEGKAVATNTVYKDFTLSKDPNEQSYAFWNVVKGYQDTLVQDAREDDTSEHGYMQYIGVKRRDADGMVQIGVSPQRLADRVKTVQLDYVLDNIAVENQGFVFAVKKEDGTITHFTSDGYVGQPASAIGLGDAALQDEYTGYQTIDSTKCLVSSMEYNGQYIYVAVPTHNVGNGILPITIVVSILSLLLMILFSIPMLISRKIEEHITEESKQEEDAGFKEEPKGMIRVPDGGNGERQVQSVAGRWLGNSGLAWNEKTPEQKLQRVIFGLLAVAAIVFFYFIYQQRGAYDKNSIISYILNQKWEKKPNIFSFTYMAIIMIEVIVVVGIVRKLIMSVFSSLGARMETVGRLLNSFAKYVSVIATLFYCLSLVGIDSGALLASAGIFGLVVGLGAQSLISDILAGIFIVFEGEFRVGDIVTIGDWRGTVREIGVRSTKIEDGSQNIKIINNSNISMVINMTKKYSYAFNDVGIEYNESLEHVEAILKEELPLLKERVPGIVAGPYYKGVVALGDSSVMIRILSQCEENDRIQLTRDLNRQLKLIFDRHHISIPFPQVVINQPMEQRTATKAEKTKAEAFVEEQKETSKGFVISDK